MLLMNSPRSATAYPMVDLGRRTVDLCPGQKVLIFHAVPHPKQGQYSLQVHSDINFIFLRPIWWTTFLVLLLWKLHYKSLFTRNFTSLCPSESLSKFNIVSIVTNTSGQNGLHTHPICKSVHQKDERYRSQKRQCWRYGWTNSKL